MAFIIFIFCCNILIPFIMILFGWIMLNHPPQKINGFYGYRTTWSTKSKETWDFAHALCGKLWWKYGWIMFIPSVLIQLPFLYNKDILGYMCIGLCTIQCILIVCSIIPVEKALRQHFNSDGTPKC